MSDSSWQSFERRAATGLTWLASFALALAGLYPGSNPDTFGHLAQGRQIVELGRVPQFDTWSLLPGPARPWHNYEWLSDLLFYGLYAHLGYDGVLGFKCLLLGLTGLVLLAFARRLGGERAVSLTALTLISCIPVARMRFSDRPHVLGICLAAFYFVALARLTDCAPSEQRLRRKLIVSLFGLHVLWVNLHGSHLLGLAITGAFCVLGAKPARKALLSVLGLQAIASCISPYGPYIVIDAIEHVLDPRYRGLVTEWMPWTPDDPPWLQLGPALQAALLALVGPRVARLGASGRAGLGVALLLGVATFRSIRFVAEFMLLSAPLLGTGLANAFETLDSRRWVTRVSALFFALCALVPWGASQLPPFVGIGHGVSYVERPHGPGMLLERLGPHARVFGSIETNWYLMWEAPQARFIIDGRVPFYGPEFVTGIVAAFSDADTFKRRLRENDITAIVLKHTMNRDNRLIQAIQSESGWSLALIDDAFAVFVREDVALQHGLSAFTALKPDFDSERVLRATPDERRAIERELERLTHIPTARGYRLWGLALLELAPLRLPDERVGLRWPVTPEERGRYQRALTYLNESASDTGNVPIVSSTHALVAALLCDFAVSERALARADLFAPTPGREAVLARQEIALRTGRVDEVAAFVRAARQTPGGRHDAALAQLAKGIDSPPKCEGAAP